MDFFICQEVYYRYYVYYQSDFIDFQVIVGRVYLERNGCLEKFIYNFKFQYYGCFNYMDNFNRRFLKY